MPRTDTLSIYVHDRPRIVRIYDIKKDWFEKNIGKFAFRSIDNTTLNEARRLYKRE